MIIYHGSTVLVEKPEIRISDSFLDFGTGFYTTTSEHQAERWAKIKMRRESKNIGYVSIYEFDFELDSVYMRSSQNSQPNSDTPDMNSRKER